MRAPATQTLFSLIVAAGASCSLAAQADTRGATPAPKPAPGYTETGVATWYGPRHEGKRTTSGEVFDSRKMTAAHASLPMGSFVRVTDASSGRSIVVRVNDREPPHGIRCIDLSHAAAARLGIVSRGVADVTLAQVSAGEAATEVAEAPGDALPPEAASGQHHAASGRHGRRHRHHAHR